MTVKWVALCDLCLGDGEHVVASFVYWNDEGEEWHACARHANDVVAAGLRYKPLEEDED